MFAGTVSTEAEFMNVGYNFVDFCPNYVQEFSLGPVRVKETCNVRLSLKLFGKTIMVRHLNNLLIDLLSCICILE
jgi:hypothetical protein